jgi:hypothetical protein
VLADGVTEGRRIFANTLKYVLMGTSSNFGNIFSAAGASLFSSFLPMLPSQIPARRAAAPPRQRELLPCGCPKPMHMSCDVLIFVEEAADAVASLDLA